MASRSSTRAASVASVCAAVAVGGIAYYLTRRPSKNAAGQPHGTGGTKEQAVSTASMNLAQSGVPAKSVTEHTDELKIADQDLDLVPVHVEIHLNFVCNGCECSPMMGARFECNQCEDFHLCNRCMFVLPHKAGHCFTRCAGVEAASHTLSERMRQALVRAMTSVPLRDVYKAAVAPITESRFKHKDEVAKGPSANTARLSCVFDAVIPQSMRRVTEDTTEDELRGLFTELLEPLFSHATVKAQETKRNATDRGTKHGTEEEEEEDEDEEEDDDDDYNGLGLGLAGLDFRSERKWSKLESLIRKTVEALNKSAIQWLLIRECLSLVLGIAERVTLRDRSGSDKDERNMHLLSSLPPLLMCHDGPDHPGHEGLALLGWSLIAAAERRVREQLGSNDAASSELLITPSWDLLLRSAPQVAAAALFAEEVTPVSLDAQATAPAAPPSTGQTLSVSSVATEIDGIGFDVDFVCLDDMQDVTLAPRNQEVTRRRSPHVQRLLAQRDHETPEGMLVFISHRWLQKHHPDPEGYDWATVQRSLWRSITNAVDTVALLLAVGVSLHDVCCWVRHKLFVDEATGINVCPEIGGFTSESFWVQVFRLVLQGCSAPECKVNPQELLLDTQRRIDLARWVGKRTYVWFDYVCLPQGLRTPDQDKRFRATLRCLSSLLRRMHVLTVNSAEAYMERAWCVSEWMLGDHAIVYSPGESVHIDDEAMPWGMRRYSLRRKAFRVLLDARQQSATSVLRSMNLQITNGKDDGLAVCRVLWDSVRELGRDGVMSDLDKRDLWLCLAEGTPAEAQRHLQDLIAHGEDNSVRNSLANLPFESLPFVRKEEVASTVSDKEKEEKANQSAPIVHLLMFAHSPAQTEHGGRCLERDICALALLVAAFAKSCSSPHAVVRAGLAYSTAVKARPHTILGGFACDRFLSGVADVVIPMPGDSLIEHREGQMRLLRRLGV